MDLNEYIDFIIVAEELDKLGRYAESDNLVRLAQFPNMNPQGFGGFGNMGAGNGNLFTPQMQGAAIGGALGNAAFKSPVGTALGTLVGSEFGRKQGNDIQQRNIPSEQKIQKLKEELIKLQAQPEPRNYVKMQELQRQITTEEKILKDTQTLRAQNQPQTSPQTANQTGLPASASLDQLKAYNAARDAKSFDELQKLVVNFTLAEQALAFRFWNLKSQQAATQTPGQPAGQLQATQMPPAVNNILMSMLYDPTMTTPQAIWSKISTSEQIPEGLKRAAFDEFLKLRSNQIYGAAQAQAPTPAQSQFTPAQEIQIDNLVDLAIKQRSGQKFNFIKNKYLKREFTKPIYDEIIKRLKERVEILQSTRQK
jgi:hypothetical protein